jgi:hypothetical protein
MSFSNTNIPLILLDHETAIRLVCFLGIFIAIAVLEIVIPRRPLIVKKSLRWFGNLSVQIVNGFLPRLIFPILPVGMAGRRKDGGC